MTPRRSFILAAFAAALLAGCDEPRVHETPVRINDDLTVRLTWYRPGADRLIVLFGSPDAQRTAAAARTLAWPDRAVATLTPTVSVESSPPRCADLVAQTTGRLAQVRRANGPRGRLQPPVLVGMKMSGGPVLALAGEAAGSGASAAVTFEYCPGDTPEGYFCSVDHAIPAEPSDLPLVAITDKARCGAQDLTPGIRHFLDSRVIAADGDDRMDLLSTAVDQVIGRVSDGTPGQDRGIPVVPLPAAGDRRQLVVFLSGDGGWADIDRQIGEELSRRGVAVVGFDSLKYFWRRKDPAQAAADLARIIAQYSSAWRRDDVILVGYSFGADVLPFLWQDLDAGSRQKVSHIVFLGLGSAASFEITVGGWVGVTPAEAVPTAPAVRSISGAKVICIYGTDENGDICPTLASYGVDTVPVPGGHHFGGDYKSFADLILTRITSK